MNRDYELSFVAFVWIIRVINARISDVIACIENLHSIDGDTVRAQRALAMLTLDVNSKTEKGKKVSPSRLKKIIYIIYI